MKTIGIIGGGQLGLMIAEQAHVLGVRAVALDPAPDAPAFRVCDDHLVAAYDDAAALEELCRQSDAVTYEFENVPGDILIPLSEKYNIPQGYRPLYDSQDRLREKSNARDHGLQTPRFAAVDDEASLRAAVRELGLPAVLKTRTLGYDGHGQAVLRSESDIERALPLLTVPCILEEFIPFDSEASIVMVADRERVVSFPVGRNIHRDGILDLSIVPAAADPEVLGRLKSQSERFMREYGLSEYDADVLTSSRDVADYFCAVCKSAPDKKIAANWVMGEVAASVNAAEGMTYAAAPVTAAALADILKRLADGTINAKGAKRIFSLIWEGAVEGVDALIEREGLKQISDASALEGIIDDVLKNNPKMIEEFKAGKQKAFNALVGQAMKATRGKANPKQVNEILSRKLQG